MKIQIEATSTVTKIDEVETRVWEGLTERGTKCKVFVHRIAVHIDEDATQFESELKEMMPPLTGSVPLNHVL